MEENEDKKPEVNEPEAPEAEPEKPVESGSEAPKEKGGKLDAIKGKAKAVKEKAKEKAKVVKQKTGEFMGVKRNRIIVLACSGAAIVALVVGLSVGLTQCHGNGGDNTSSSNSESKGGEGSGSSSSSSESSSSAHTHEYGTAWKSDATQHWHECSCGDKKDVADHAFSTERVVTKEATPTEKGKKGYQCTVCEYAKDEIDYTPYITSENLSASLKFTGEKITIHCDTVSDGVASEDTETKNGNIVHCVATGDGAADIYYTVEGEGADAKYYEYLKGSDGLWSKSEDASKYYNVYSSFDANVSAFDSAITYDKIKNGFDSVKGAYVTSYTNQYGTEINVELYFNNGRLLKAVKSYEKVVRTYTFSDDAETLTLPSVHVHTVASGSLDLNGTTPKIKGTCSVCHKEEVTKDYEATDTASVITYGYYPQTHVTDTTTIASLDALQSAGSNGWYLLNGTYYAKVANATPCGDGYSFSDGTTIGNACYWFKVEPVEWKVVSSSDGQYSLVSSLILDNQVFHSTKVGNTNVYANSDLRTWLTGAFYNAVFSNGGSYLQAYTSGGLDDKVYLNSSRDQCKVSDYAKAIGVRIPSGYDCGDYWTTAVSSYTSYMATIACGDGGCTYRDVNIKYGVRPAITVKIS